MRAEDPTIAQVLQGPATRLANSARTISAIATSTCPPCTYSSATSIISTPKKSRIRRLPEGPGLPEEIRTARRHEMQGHGQGRPDGRSGVRQGGQAGHRKHRPPHPEADGDGGRRVHRRGARLHGAQDQGRRAVALLLQPDAHACLHASEAVIGRQDRSWTLPGRDGRARRLRRPATEEA